MMALSLLITQCLQRDFVEPISPYSPLPNALHVGSEEARRLIGMSPELGPVAQLMAWARQQESDSLQILHLRDWHDEEALEQHSHFHRFGAHCVRGTKGAELLVEPLGSAERVIDSTSLNDFVDTPLGPILDELKRQGGKEGLRIGVVGVWTEAKVSFLLYELLTRGYATELATCSALVASASRAQHFNALAQLRKLLGVKVFHSIGEFTQWLLPDGKELTKEALLPQEHTCCPQLELPQDTNLSSVDRDIIGFLYRDSASLTLHPLGGGFSGARVFQVRSRDALGHVQSPSVLKLETPELVGEERAAFERVESILGNSAPRVHGFADLGEQAGLKYAYAAMGQGKVTTFKSLYESSTEADQQKIDTLLDEVYGEILGRFYSASHYERLNLFDYYTFDSRYCEGVRKRVTKIVGAEEAQKAEIGFRPGVVVPNVADFYGKTLDTLPRHIGESHFVSYVHGDLNGANILLDSHDNVWLIDFFHAHRGHLLRDLAKMESDLLYIFTKIESEKELDEAILLTKALLSVGDLRQPLGPLPKGINTSSLKRAWATLQTLRKHVGQIVKTERNPLHLHIALLRYAVHTLSFDESSLLQKKWALLTGGMLAQSIGEELLATKELRVDWLSSKEAIGLTICPGRRDRGRKLEADIDALLEGNVQVLVGCMTKAEMKALGVDELPQRCEDARIRYLHLPMVDQGVPTLLSMKGMVKEIIGAIKEDSKVVIHCLGGLGRSGTTAACTLVSLGLEPAEAIAQVRRARGPRAVESQKQEEFVFAFHNQAAGNHTS